MVGGGLGPVGESTVGVASVGGLHPLGGSTGGSERRRGGAGCRLEHPSVAGFGDDGLRRKSGAARTAADDSFPSHGSRTLSDATLTATWRQAQAPPCSSHSACHDF